VLYNKDSVETSRTEMFEESQDTVESASPNRESLCSTMTPGIDAKINDVIEQNPAYGLKMLALGEMVSQRFLVPLFEVRVLEGQPRSFGVAVNTSACHAEDHGFDSRKDRHKVMWRNGYAEDCKSFYPGSIPGITSRL
jgi:hypothetical protein